MYYDWESLHNLVTIQTAINFKMVQQWQMNIYSTESDIWLIKDVRYSKAQKLLKFTFNDLIQHL